MKHMYCTKANTRISHMAEILYLTQNLHQSMSTALWWQQFCSTSNKSTMNTLN